LKFIASTKARIPPGQWRASEDAVLRRHQREAQHFAPRQRRPHPQPGPAALQVIEIAHVDVDRLVERLLAVKHDHRSHQLRHGRDRGDFVRRFCVDLTIRGSVEHEDVGR
jgi:hypothetical protein